jgi:hypothetical protein
MSDWSNIWQGIGQLGQTKRDMLTPLLEARRNRGEIWDSGLGRISDTLGRMGDKRFQAGEAKKQRDWQGGEAQKGRDFEAIQNNLDREVQYTNIYTDKEISEMNNQTLIDEARKNREQEAELQRLAEIATDDRQKEEIEYRLKALRQDWNMFEDKLSQDQLQWLGEMGYKYTALAQDEALGTRELDIRDKEADLNTAILKEQLSTMKDSKAGAIWKDIKVKLIDDFSTLFQGVDAEGYAFNSALYDLARQNPDALKDVRAQFMNYVADHSDKVDILTRLFDGAIGTLPPPKSETELNPRGVPAGGSFYTENYTEQQEALGILKDWLTQDVDFKSIFGNILGKPQFTRERWNEIKKWFREPVLGYRKSDVGKMLYALSEAIPDMIGEEGGQERYNPDQTTIDNYVTQLVSEDIPIRRLQEIAEELKVLQQKYIQSMGITSNPLSEPPETKTRGNYTLPIRSDSEP